MANYGNTVVIVVIGIRCIQCLNTNQKQIHLVQVMLFHLLQLIWKIIMLDTLQGNKIRVQSNPWQIWILNWLRVFVMPLFSLYISYVITLQAQKISSVLFMKRQSTRKVDRIFTRKRRQNSNFPFGIVHYYGLSHYYQFALGISRVSFITVLSKMHCRVPFYSSNLSVGNSNENHYNMIYKHPY